MPRKVSKTLKSSPKQNGTNLTQTVKNEMIYIDLLFCKIAGYCKTVQYFSYQTVSRVVTEAG
jgi:hypothetical protein